jgi:hypothetical protein
MKLTPEAGWALLGGKPWLSPLNATMYRLLVGRAQHFLSDSLVVVSLANYREHWQLALDCNLPGDVRDGEKSLAITYGAILGNRIEYLSGVERPSVVPLSEGW